MRAWVIGGETGIGEEIARELSIRQYETYVSKQSEVDVRDYHALVKWIDDLGPFDITIYSAGVNIPNFIPNVNLEDLDLVYQVNVIGFVKVLKALVRSQDYGKVIGISSEAHRVAMRGSIAYCSSKAAMAMAIRCAGRELAPNWQILGVAPVVVEDTPITTHTDKYCAEIRGVSEKEIVEDSIKKIPYGRRLTKIEVAGLTCDLLKTTPFLTGVTIDLAGGL
jgi:NAD(P)-dependent dehydrogenase (short-subunit alcohol dehydrogenase family)